jgi:hypothetical protein
VASKLLRNPLGQILSYNYLVTGSWDDPKVEKVMANNAPAATPNGQSTVPPASGAAGGSNEAAR